LNCFNEGYCFKNKNVWQKRWIYKFHIQGHNFISKSWFSV
jgi:hypothetical protein